MAIGNGWADGAWVDDGWVTGAWDDGAVAATIIVDKIANYVLNTNLKSITIYKGKGSIDFFIIWEVN